MADIFKTDGERRKRIFLFGALMICAVLFLAPAGMVEHLQSAQEHITAQELGQNSLNAISVPAAATTTALLDLIHIRWFLDSSSSFMVSRGQTLAAGIYAITWRLIYFFFVVLLASGVIWAAAYDGLRRRKISQWRYEYPSPMRHFISRNTALRMIEFLLFAAVLPIPVPPILMLPWLGMFAASVRTWGANLQQRI